MLLRLVNTLPYSERSSRPSGNFANWNGGGLLNLGEGVASLLSTADKRNSLQV